LHESAEMQFPGAPERVRMHEVVRGLIDWLVSGLLEGTASAAQGLADVEAVRAHPERVVRFTPATADGSAQLKRFLRAQVYESKHLVLERERSVERIERLFELLLAQPEWMPAAYREDSAGESLHRQVCDYIAGMTDGFFARSCDQLGI